MHLTALHIKCLTQDGLKSQMPSACPCLVQPRPQAGTQRERTPLFPGGEEPLRKGPPRLPWIPSSLWPTQTCSKAQRLSVSLQRRGGSRRQPRQEQTGSAFLAGQGRLCSFKSPSSLPARGVKEKSDTFFLGDVNGQARTASCLFHSFSTQPPGMAGNERANCAPVEAQVGREPRRLQEPGTAPAHLGK